MFPAVSCLTNIRKKVIRIFSIYNPFPESTNTMPIFSGVIEGDSINCQKAYEVGRISNIRIDM